jgi:recombination protein RecA
MAGGGEWRELPGSRCRRYADVCLSLRFSSSDRNDLDTGPTGSVIKSSTWEKKVAASTKARKKGEKDSLGNIDQTISDLIKEINGKDKDRSSLGTARGKHGIHSEVAGVVSTGSIALDKAIGVGGLPLGRVIEIYGPESSGKTTLTLHAIADAQQKGMVAAFIDAEHALDMEYAAALGVDLEQLLLSQPDSGEEALQIVDDLIRTNKVGIIVIDSVAALVPASELAGDMGDHHPGAQARLMSQALRKITGAIHRSHCVVIFINQIRYKIGVKFGSPETTSGGNALKFYASVRLDIRRIAGVKTGEELTANRTKVTVRKNKVAPPFKKAEFDIAFGVGVDQAAELLDFGIAAGVLTRKGSWYSCGEKRLGQGRDRTKQTILEDPELFKMLQETAMAFDA